MKRAFGTHFQFDVPQDWEEFREGGRHVWQGPGPALQELIIQGTLLEGEGSARQEEEALEQLVENALHGIRVTLSDEALVTDRPLASDASLALQPAWSARARAPADKTLFCSAVFRGGLGVLLVTFEASPEGPADVGLFEAVVGSVRRASDLGRA